MAVRGLRKMVIYNQEWKYAVGRTGVVVLYDPKGKKHIAHYSDVTGYPTELYHNQLRDEVRPQDIREYIEKHF